MFEALAPLLISAAKQIIDALVPGDKLTSDAIKGIKTGYVAAKLWLPKVVNDSANTYDNEGLEMFLSLCEDTLTEAGEPVPSI